MKKVFLPLFITCFFCGSLLICSSQSTKPNIIFIVIDDMNDYMGKLGGQPQIQTPVLDSLFDLGTTFMNAFCNAPVCGPSRTSMMSGKDMKYTQVYANDPYIDEFRDNFTAAKGNEEVITIPEYLKDAGQYYTCSINKVFHDSFNKDYDVATPDPCLKSLSWSKAISFGDFESTTAILEESNEGVTKFFWGLVDSSIAVEMKDYRVVDSAIQFLDDVVSGNIPLCDSVFFLALGFALPHLNLYVPENYYPDEYLKDIYAEPFNLPYNYPVNAFPYNGIVMPPQPDPKWNDYNLLGTLGKVISAGQYETENSFTNYIDSLPYLPTIDPLLSDDERKEILMESKRADAIMAYMAAIQFIDAQIGRFINNLILHPEIYENTVIILVGDNGFSLGEKHHWMKRSLWDTDIRIPFAIIDPAHPAQQVSYNTASLMDIFPTICDIAGISYPTFANGDPYLDGKSLMPILNDPDIAWAHPELISWEAEADKELSCFPQYAVRDERFAYIRYASDGGNPVNECNIDSSFVEEELYEVGVHRETDPNEWNNLIHDPDYANVINYLQQFLPDSNLYLQKTYKAIIQNNMPECLISKDDTIKLSFEWFDENGIAVTPSPFFNFKWTNNLTNDILSGTTAEFPVNLISDADYDEGKRLMFYLQAYDISGNLIAFDTKYFYLNPESEPNGTFTILSDGSLTAYVTDFAITGSYTNYWWEINGDSLFYNQVPGPCTFDEPGTYTLTLFIQYGNTPCIKSFSQTIITETFDANWQEDMVVFPNPANDLIHILFSNSPVSGQLEIFDLNGQIVKSISLDVNTIPVVEINISELASGLYLLHFTNGENHKAVPFMIMHNP